MSQLLTVKQAAYILKVHPLTVRRYIKERKLVALRVGGNVRIREEDLNSLQSTLDPEPTTKRPLAFKKLVLLFGFDDPLWRLEGRAASLSLPEED